MSLLINLFVICILIILPFWVFYCDSKKYCSAEFCNNTKEHVLCKFQFQGPSRNCINYVKLLTTAEEKQDLLHKMNSRRNKVASGEIRSLPAAENMVKLVWNNELEVSAQRWADQCVKSSLYDGTDSCRDLEILHTLTPGKQLILVPKHNEVKKQWFIASDYPNKRLRTFSLIAKIILISSLTGMQHYDYFTQLVWGITSQVGCGGVKFKEVNKDSSSYQNRTVYRLVCNFAPAGNRIDKSVYNFGIPCSRCFGSSCSSEYNFLCSSNVTADENPGLMIDASFNSYKDDPNFFELRNFKINSVEHTSPMPKMMENLETQFDFFSDLFESTKLSQLRTEQSTTKCKEVLAVDEFIELLKSRLRNDRILKDLLISSTISTPEPVFSDQTVAAIIKQLYSKKETTTTTRSTENDSLNSTLLVDLVEAVIFRHSDKYSSTEDGKLLTQSVSDVRPVKIQAELGEVKFNKEFTGHYFFPEEEEQTEQETDDLYDETLPTSEISLEIEDLKRSRATKDFIEEILESDFVTEDTKSDDILSTVNNRNGFNMKSILYNSSRWLNSTFKENKRFKRKTNNNLFIKYSDLLKKLAADLKKTKLHEKYHCAYSSTEQVFPHFFVIVLVFIVYLLKYIE